MKSSSQLRRLGYLLIYLSIFFIINYYLFHTIVPQTTNKGFWLYTGLVSLILGDLLVTPFFTSPANGLSYSTAGLIAVLFTTPIRNIQIFDLTIFYLCGLIFLSLLCIITLNFESESCKKVSFSSKIIVDSFGNPSIIYFILLIYAVFQFHFESSIEVILILSCGLIVVMKVVERVDEVAIKILLKIGSQIKYDIIGVIEAFQTPGIFLVKLELGIKVAKNTLLLLNDCNFGMKLGIAIGYTGRNENLFLRVLELETNKEIESELNSCANLQENAVILLPDNVKSCVLAHKINDGWDNFIGIIDKNSTIENVFIEIINEHEIEEGALLEVVIKGKRVLCQILEGITEEDIVSQKNKYGYAQAKARKIGAWNTESKKFENVKWIPNINSPVFIKKDVIGEIPPEAIGTFPKTNYFVSVKDIDRLVTYNTAILGILGVGKSMFCIELLERLITNKIKIICIDLTNQYAEELKDFIDERKEDKSIQFIIEAGQNDASKINENPEEGGSYPMIREAFYEDIKEFINNDNYYLKIYNPSIINGTRQYSEPKSVNGRTGWTRVASLWSISPVEITQIITEECLRVVQDKMSDKARVCLVFEEAHSLVPEWNSVVNEGDKRASTGTARAILQGRKFGMGCILVTQRTANVTKTILNQCNTIFAMRTFDETGKEFLSNYFGYDYTKILSSIPERQAVVFGKASSCENPVLIRFNDRQKFLNSFRAINKVVPLPEWKDENITSDKQELVPENNRSEDNELAF